MRRIALLGCPTLLQILHSLYEGIDLLLISPPFQCGPRSLSQDRHSGYGLHRAVLRHRYHPHHI